MLVIALLISSFGMPALAVDTIVPYLVIVSAYNPSSSGSVGDFYLNFE